MSNVDPQAPEFQGTSPAASPQQIAAMQEEALRVNPNSFGLVEGTKMNVQKALIIKGKIKPPAAL